MSRIKRLGVAVVCCGLMTACKDDGNTLPGPTPGGTRTTTFSGTASTNASGGCSSPGHTIQTAAGTIAVQLTSADRGSAKLQICHPTAVNHALECTVPPFAVLTVGQRLEATLKGGAAQTVTIYPAECGAPGTPPAATVAYTIEVTYPF